MLDKAADHERLAVFQLHGGVDALRVPTRNVGAVDGGTERGVEAADFRFDLQMNSAIAKYDRQEIQSCAEFLELHADLAEAGRDRDRLLAAGQEAGRAAAQRDQAGLRQELDDVLVAEGLEEAEEALLVVDQAQEKVARTALQKGVRG